MSIMFAFILRRPYRLYYLPKNFMDFSQDIFLITRLFHRVKGLYRVD